MRNAMNDMPSDAAGATAQTPLHLSRDHVIHDSGRAWYVLVMLTLAYSLAYIDRQLLNLLVEPI
jgi:hypothetical protein